MKKTSLFLILILFAHSMAAQPVSTDSKRAKKAYYEALNAYDRMQFEEAIDQMQKAIRADENFVEAYMVLADIHTDAGNTEKAIASYRTILNKKPDFFPPAYYNLALLELELEHYEEAYQELNKFYTYPNQHPQLLKKAKKLYETAKFGKEAIKNPVPFEPRNLGDSVNSKFDEYWPALTADEQQLLMTRKVPRKKDEMPPESGYLKEEDLNKDYRNILPAISREQEDFYVSYRQRDHWQKAFPMPGILNSKGNEGAQTITADGRTMIFTACDREGGVGGCDLYITYLEGNTWTEPENMGQAVNSTTWDSQPAVSSDGRMLFFTSARPGGKGNKDIWVSYKQANGQWSEPENLGDSINTSEEDISPFIHPDGVSLYFSSSGHPGMGGNDLYISKRTNNGGWTAPKNLGYPINTKSDEVGLFVNARGNMAYYSSDRKERNGLDIYAFELYKEVRPQPVSYFKGIVFDKKTDEKLQASFELIDLSNRKTVSKSFSDPVNGDFLLCIPTDKDYALNVSKDGYLFYSDHFELKGKYEATDPFIKDIPLIPIEKGQRIILRNIFFATDSYELKETSIVELEKTYEFLKKNPDLQVEISGHTDNVGTEEYNMELSHNRARAVYNYLVEKGIDEQRLSYKGYGETQFISENDTPEGRAENRRTELKIIDY